ncbi:hypothetical protein [Halioglobus sp. HI00S01]|uniref:hypothetical protein n=1 Tax=Halioglobus sp. HI00S01 TaxID=1822214 RepID=UPI001E5F82F1|nr:hypothetical protein [Halioglobus sp. HI00S01]
MDTALIQVPSPDQHVNPSMPRTHGDSFINIRDIDSAYMNDRPSISPETAPESDVERRIG